MGILPSCVVSSGLLLCELVLWGTFCADHFCANYFPGVFLCILLCELLMCEYFCADHLCANYLCGGFLCRYTSGGSTFVRHFCVGDTSVTSIFVGYFCVDYFCAKYFCSDYFCVISPLRICIIWVLWKSIRCLLMWASDDSITGFARPCFFGDASFAKKVVLFTKIKIQGYIFSYYISKKIMKIYKNRWHI